MGLINSVIPLIGTRYTRKVIDLIYFLEQIEKWLTFNLSAFEFKCDLLSLFQTMQSVLFSFILKDCTSDRRPCIFHAAETKSNRLSEKAHRISHETTMVRM